MRYGLYEIYNTTREQLLSNRAVLAADTASRMRGLLGRDSFEKGEGLIIAPCNSIHTLFMRFPIDVVFVDRTGKIVRQFRHLKPWRVTGIYFRSAQVVELPAGVLENTATQEGDVLRLTKR